MAKKKLEGDVSTHAKISTLEANYDRLHDDVGDLRSGLRDLAEEMRKGFRSIIDGARTDWSSYASWAAIVLAIVGMLGSGYVRDLDRIESLQSEMQYKMTIHQESIGHHGMVEKVETLQKELERVRRQEREDALKLAEFIGGQKMLNKLLEKKLLK